MLSNGTGRRRSDSSANLRSLQAARRSALRAMGRTMAGVHSAVGEDKRWHASSLTIAKERAPWHEARRYWQLSCITLSQGPLAPRAVSESHSLSLYVTHAHHEPPKHINSTQAHRRFRLRVICISTRVAEDVSAPVPPLPLLCMKAGLSPPHLQSSDPLGRRVWLVVLWAVSSAACGLSSRYQHHAAHCLLPPPSSILRPPSTAFSPPGFLPPSRLQTRPHAAHILPACALKSHYSIPHPR